MICTSVLIASTTELRHPVVNAYLWRKWEESRVEIGKSLRMSIVSTWLTIWLVLNKFTMVKENDFDPHMEQRLQQWFMDGNACLWTVPGRAYKFHVFICLFIFVFILR